MKIYTKTGDQGTTSLYGGTRVTKHHIRVECNGAIDELNSWLGLLRDQEISPKYREALIRVQECLFTLGAAVATEPVPAGSKGSKRRQRLPEPEDSEVRFLEQEIDRMNESLAPMTHFILPGGHPIVSYCHITRTVCRRAERHCTRLQLEEPLHPVVLVYLNRLSDYLFMLARALSQELQIDEIKWVPGQKG